MIAYISRATVPTYLESSSSNYYWLETLCLQSFQTVSSVDPKWHLTSMKNNRDHLLNKGYLKTKFEVHATFISWDNVFTMFSDFDLWWHQITFDLHGKQYGSSTHQGIPTYQVWSSGKFHLLRYRVYKVFSLWPLVTSNDLWPPWKTIGIIYVPRATNIPSLKFQQLSLIDITCLQGFQVQAIFTYWDTVFTRFSVF